VFTRIILLVCLWLPYAVPAHADQFAYIRQNEVTAAMVVAINQEVVHIFCAPCGDVYSKPIRVAEISARRVSEGSNSDWELLVNGEGVDLAYTYVAVGGHWQNLAHLLGLDPIDVPGFLGVGELVHLALAQDTAFRTVQLAYGISLDVPSHWAVLSLEDRKNIGAAGQAMAENVGIEGPSGRKESLLAMNATPSPTGAMIRVSVTSPPDLTQADLAAATPSDLQEIGTEMLGIFRQLETPGGLKIIKMQPVRIERINNYRALVISYIRAGATGPFPWQVTQYKIPVSNHLIEITLSHRKPDAVVWRPILERVKRSIKF